jgi:hypothetical protein
MFVSNVVELKLFLSAPAPPTPAPRSRRSELRLRLQLRFRIVLKDHLKNQIFYLTNKIKNLKIVTIFKNLSLINFKEAGATICNFSFGSRRQFDFGSSALAPQQCLKERIASNLDSYVPENIFRI